MTSICGYGCIEKTDPYIGKALILLHIFRKKQGKTVNLIPLIGCVAIFLIILFVIGALKDAQDDVSEQVHNGVRSLENHSIQGYVYTADGNQGLANVSVDLLEENLDGKISLVKKTTTDKTGKYVFSHVSAVTLYAYLVTLVPNSNNTLTHTSSVSNIIHVQKKVINTGPTFYVQPNTTTDFGIEGNVCEGNIITKQCNVHDLRSIENVQVGIFDANGLLIQGPVNVDAQGYYLFMNLVAGNYIVRIISQNSGTYVVKSGNAAIDLGVKGITKGPDFVTL